MQIRFLVFGYDGFYPKGGMDDCIGKSNTFEGAEKLVRKHKEEERVFDYYDIYDISLDEKYDI